MPRAGFEPVTPATKRPQTYALDRAAAGIGCLVNYFRLLFLLKAVPLHAMEALGGRGGIAPTYSRPRH
jgi:hypothetical protein